MQLFPVDVFAGDVALGKFGKRSLNVSAAMNA